jgi:hypothetical protein
VSFRHNRRVRGWGWPQRWARWANLPRWPGRAPQSERTPNAPPLDSRRPAPPTRPAASCCTSGASSVPSWRVWRWPTGRRHRRRRGKADEAPRPARRHGGPGAGRPVAGARRPAGQALPGDHPPPHDRRHRHDPPRGLQRPRQAAARGRGREALAARLPAHLRRGPAGRAWTSRPCRSSPGTPAWRRSAGRARRSTPPTGGNAPHTVA